MIICKQEKYNKKKKPNKKNVYIFKYCWGNVVSYVVKDSWTKHNQFTAELFLHWDQAHRNEELKKKQCWKTVTHSVLATGTLFLWGPTAKVQKSLPDDWTIAKYLPPPSVEPGALLRDWIMPIPRELY